MGRREGGPTAWRWARLPWGFVGMLALVAGVEWLIGRAGDRLAGYEGLGVRFAARAAVGEATRADVLAIGDSTVKFGFDPAAVGRRVGGGAYNLAVPGTPTPLSHALLKRALGAGARPRAVVVGQLTLGGNLWPHVDQFGEFAGLGDCLTLAWSVRDANLFAALVASRVLPSVRYRRAIAPALRAGPADDSVEKRLRAWSAGRGAESQPADAPFAGKIAPALEAMLYAPKWGVEPVFERYLRRTHRLASDQGVAVFWLVPPVAPSVRARREALGLDARHTLTLQALQTQMPGVVVLDARHCRLTDADFFDPIHLNARGARVLSEAVGAAIADRLDRAGGPRWVDLSGRENPADRMGRVPLDPPR